jgi:hypothetical protein
MVVDLIKAPHHEQMMLYVAGLGLPKPLWRASIRLLKITFLTDLIFLYKTMRTQIPFPAKTTRLYR